MTTYQYSDIGVTIKKTEQHDLVVTTQECNKLLTCHNDKTVQHVVGVTTWLHTY